MTAVLPVPGAPVSGKETSVRPGSRRGRSSDGEYGLVASSRAWRVLISAVLVLTGVLMLLPVAWVVLDIARAAPASSSCSPLSGSPPI